MYNYNCFFEVFLHRQGEYSTKRLRKILRLRFQPEKRVSKFVLQKFELVIVSPVGAIKLQT